jgi:hypothetical protein
MYVLALCALARHSAIAVLYLKLLDLFVQLQCLGNTARWCVTEDKYKNVFVTILEKL